MSSKRFRLSFGGKRCTIGGASLPTVKVYQQKFVDNTDCPETRTPRLPADDVGYSFTAPSKVISHNTTSETVGYSLAYASSSVANSITKESVGYTGGIAFDVTSRAVVKETVGYSFTVSRRD